MTMFPDLSKKALDEINTASEAFGLFAFGEDYGIVTNPQKAVNAFRSLFDLEKYPITKDMLFGYLLDTDFDMLSGSNAKDFEAQYETYHEHIIITDCTPIPVAIDDISCALQKDKSIIIGEIHGWWEKGKSE